MSDIVTGLNKLKPKLNTTGLALPDCLSLRDYFAAQALPVIYKDYCDYAHANGWLDN